jgi:hypothetical protein
VWFIDFLPHAQIVMSCIKINIFLSSSFYSNHHEIYVWNFPYFFSILIKKLKTRIFPASIGYLYCHDQQPTTHLTIENIKILEWQSKFTVDMILCLLSILIINNLRFSYFLWIYLLYLLFICLNDPFHPNHQHHSSVHCSTPMLRNNCSPR